MQSPPISEVEIDARIDSHIDELLELWWAEQGASKPKDLELMALTIPFPRGQAIRALDLCCGPGDVGRSIRRIYPRRTSTASIETRSSRRSAEPSISGNAYRERLS